MEEEICSLILNIFFSILIFIPFIVFISKGIQVLIDQLDKYSKSGDFSDVGFQTILTTIRNEIIKRVLNSIEKLPFLDAMNEQMLNNYFKSFNAWLLKFSQSFVTDLPDMTLFLVIMIFTIYSMLKNALNIKIFFQNIFGFNNDEMNELVFIFQSDSKQVYISNFLTGSIQSVIVATGVAIVIKADWFLVFFVTLIFSFLPVIGAAPMAFLFAIVSFLQGGTTGAIILFIVGVFAGLIDNVLRPWLTTFGNTKAPPIVSFICVVGGAITLGFPGLFLGLLLSSIAFDTLPLFWRHIFKFRIGY